MESILKRFTWIAAALFVLGLSGAARAETSEEARAYFQNGVELLTETPPNYQDAYYQFKLAYEKSGQNWKVLGNLGLCALKLERDAEAIEYYSIYIKKGAGELQEEEVRQIKRDLLLLEGNVAEVEITSDASDLELSTARVGSSAPAQIHKLKGGKLTLSLRAGTQKITANNGTEPQVWEVTLAPGDKKSHTFRFAEKESGAAVGAPLRSAASSSEESSAGPKRGGGMGPLRIAGIVTAGVGVGALVAGGIFGLSSTKQEGKAQDQADDPSLCRENGAGENVCVSSAESAFDKARTQALLSNIFFIGGGVLATAGVTMIIVGGKSAPSETATLSLSPSVVPFGGGFAAHGRF